MDMFVERADLYILEPRTYFVGDGISAECDRSANDEECKWGGEFHFDIVGFVVKNETDEIFFVVCEFVRGRSEFVSGKKE